MQVIGYDPDYRGCSLEFARARKAHSVEELLRQSDFVTLHAPLLDATRD
jgi:D-3-phosphoglycerate dehydrogenase